MLKATPTKDGFIIEGAADASGVFPEIVFAGNDVVLTVEALPNSVLIAWLLALKRKAMAEGVRLRVEGTALHRLLRLYRLDAFFS